MVKINSLQLENVKRIKAVQMQPKSSGLTIIGGDNGQGKTSILDAIAWALGGERFRPSQPQREGSLQPPSLRIELSNGIIVERKGKNSALKVTDPTGRRGGQQLLSEFLSELALDLPRFMRANNKEKAQTLLHIIGVGEQLAQMEREAEECYNRRRTIGQIADQKKKYAAEMPFYPDAPAEPVSASDLIAQMQDILAQNGENQRKRNQLDKLLAQAEAYTQRIARLEEDLKQAQTQLAQINHDISIARTDALDLIDRSTDELEAQIHSIDEINAKVRSNMARDHARAEADTYTAQYDLLTEELEGIRGDIAALLDGADMPLPGLLVKDGELVYNGRSWDCMSGSEQLIVSAAIVRKLNPDCGFVLMDKLEQMDMRTLEEFATWLEAEGLQVIATRVSTGDECSIIIEDGYAYSEPAEESQQKTYRMGEF